MHHIDMWSAIVTLPLHEIDLNLLVTLHTLLEERSVTRASIRLGRTQSATSHALGRLRTLFDDPLLLRSRGEMLPTPLAETLIPQLVVLMAHLKRVMSAGETFDATTTTRRFAIACPDAIGGALTTLLRWFEHSAPCAQLVLTRPPADPVARLESGDVDLLIAAQTHLPARADMMQRVFGATRMVSYLRAGHPLLDGEPMTLEAWLGVPHIQVITNDQAPNIVGGLLAQQGLSRRISTCVPNFMMALATVAATDAMFTAPDVMVGFATQRFGLRAIAPPVAMPPVDVAMFWHRRWHQDPSHRWFRDGVVDALSALTSQREVM